MSPRTGGSWNLDEAFLFERSIDVDMHDRHADELREELTRPDRPHSGQFEDVQGVLATPKPAMNAGECGAACQL